MSDIDRDSRETSGTPSGGHRDTRAAPARTAAATAPAPVQRKPRAGAPAPATPRTGAASDTADWTRVAVRPDLFSEPAGAAPVQRRETAGAAFTGPAPAGASVPETRGGGTYRIRRGDTLWRIAETTYGDGQRWRRLWLPTPPRCSATAT